MIPNLISTLLVCFLIIIFYQRWVWPWPYTNKYHDNIIRPGEYFKPKKNISFKDFKCQSNLTASVKIISVDENNVISRIFPLPFGIKNTINTEIFKQLYEKI